MSWSQHQAAACSTTLRDPSAPAPTFNLTIQSSDSHMSESGTKPRTFESFCEAKSKTPSHCKPAN